MNQPITLTDSAQQHLKNTLATDNKAIGIRLAVKDSGCSGYAYDMGFAYEEGSEDCVVEAQDVKLFIPQDSVAALQGTELDYKKEGLNAQLVFNNPNAVNACGCGESFQLKSDS